jgi:hypothetical protein
LISYIKEEDRPNVSEYRVLRKVDRSKREEVTEEGLKLGKDKLQDLYC